MPDLSQQFGRPAAASLGGLLPRRPAAAPESAKRDPAPDEEADRAAAPPDPEATSEQPTQEPTPAGAADSTGRDTGRTPAPGGGADTRRPPRTASRRLRPAPAMESESQTFQVPTYVRTQVKSAAQQRRARDQQTNAELAFEAIDATFADLHELLRQRRTTARRPDSLFPPRQRRVQGSSAQPDTRVVPWVIQATAAEIAVLDGLVGELGAESRSELIAVALEAHLLNRRR